MTGPAERPSRKPLETRTAAQLATPAYEAERAVILASLRAEAQQANANGLSLLAADYARKIADARSRMSGPELVATLAAIRSEHLAAERAMMAKLSQQASGRRRAVLAVLRTQRKAKCKNFQAAARHSSEPPSASLAPPPIAEQRRAAAASLRHLQAFRARL